VATSIAHFIAIEVRTVDTPFWLRPLAPAWHRSPIAVVWVEPVIDVAPEVSPTVKPSASADEHASFKPFWSVVARGSTGIRSNVIVSVGTIRFYDADADADADPARASREPDCDDARKDDKLECAHVNSPQRCLQATDAPAGTEVQPWY
jgi:hypothetical protein